MEAQRRNLYVTYVIVQGSGDFPYDMLRHDTCHPLTEADSVSMQRHNLRRVKLRMLAASTREPTSERWRSFRWQVCWSGTDIHDVPDELLLEPQIQR